jgi:hypothetical protein
VGTLKLNIELPRVSGGPIGVAYSATEGLGWAHRSGILSYGGSRVGSLKLNIELPRFSGGPIGVQY